MWMRELLFLSHRIPYPPNKGDKVRAWHFLRHLAETRRVHLGCFIDDERDWTHVPFLKELCGETCFVPLRRSRALVRSMSALVTKQPMTVPYYHDRRLAAWVRQLRRAQPMPVFAYSSSMAQYVEKDQRSRRIIDFVDVDSQKWSDYARRRRWPMSAVYRREGAALLSVERRIARDFDASIFVSDAEASLFRRLAPETSDRVVSVSMGVDWRHFSPEAVYPCPYGDTAGSAVCFTGMMDYWPNVDAVTWFVDTVLPGLRRSRPSTTFWIVGANPAHAVRQLGRRPGVVVTGRVPDVRPYLAHAAAVVAPLRVARGIQSKVLEAMAMGRPVIASAYAYEGLRAEAGRDLLVVESSDEFVRAIEGVFDGDAGHELGAQARRTVQREYDWSNQLSRLDSVLLSLERSTDADGARLAKPSPAVCQSES
jgi:sugar transferase (PEP-CTERM/EpsH1 system associated)